ncbi:MAG: sugar ABC transporter permease [Propionicimonas sp.]|nr:sugar ABC transporter permease [Propionicimonas sp.]
MEIIKKLFGGNLRQFGMLITLVVLIGFFQVVTGGLVMTPQNLMNLLNGNSYILILAIGMVMVIIAGHIDLSVGSVAAVVGISVAILMRDLGLTGWTGVLVGILIGLVIGLAIGAWQGFWLAFVGIPGFIVTLSGYLFFRGLNQFIGKSNTIPVSEEFKVLGAGYLPDWGMVPGLNDSTIVLGLLGIGFVVWQQLRGRARKLELGAEAPELWVVVGRIIAFAAVIVYVTFLYASGPAGTSFPVSGLILFALVVVYTFVTQRLPIGRHVYAIGGNRNAAELSGVSSRRVYFFVMANMSVLSALAGMIFISRSGASGPFDGVGWELDAIAAVFIGGAAVSGGVGTVIGSIIGGLVMAFLNNGLQLLGTGADVTQMIKGLVLLLAVAVDVWNKTQGRPSITGAIFRGRKPAPEPAPVVEAADTTPAG